MEWEQSTKNTETDEDEWEEHILNLYRNIVHSGNLIDIHSGSTAIEIDCKDTDDKQSRTSHKHQGKLHC